MGFVIGLIVGFFVGGTIGALIMSLLIIGKQADKKIETMRRIKHQEVKR